MDLLENEASITLVGSLNPAIFQPEWLAKNELISVRDLEGVDLKLIHPEITQFDLPWCRIEVQLNRFVARTKDPAYFPMLRDLVIGIFTLLEHSPVSAMGINVVARYRVRNEDYWHKVGDTLVPKGVWGKFLKSRVGMTNVSVTSDRVDAPKGTINVTVSPIISAERNGILVNLNNHLPIKSAREAIDILNEHWERLQKESINISTGLLTEAGAE